MVDGHSVPGVTDRYASDDVGGVKIPRVKLVLGADGSNDGDLSSANPLPVSSGGGVQSSVNTIAEAAIEFVLVKV